VLFGERYGRVTKEFKGLVRGEYGKTPAEISEEFRKQIIGDLEPIDYRPADKIPSELSQLKERVAPYAEQEEDLLSLALFEQVAIKFFEWRKAQKHNLDSNASAENGVHSI
jgi:oxaloacetate decarboxylase alpha subunit